MGERPVALVTGAARGIGRATAVEFARRGYDVALLDVVEHDLAEASRAVEALGCATMALHADLANLEGVEHALRGLIEAWGRLDVLVNNAAWREGVTMRRITVESWDRTLRVSLTAAAFLARWAAEVMEPARRGVIVNVSSIMGQRPAGTSPAYVVAKAGLDALTYELAALYGRSGIRVVGVRPGAVATAMSADQGAGEESSRRFRGWSEDATPLGRWAEPEEVARAIAMLASDDAAFVTGAILTVDGGLAHNFSPHSVKRLLDPREFP
jgi:3-oxoacyl-[acyl-carrier protein] reductase